MSQTTYLTSACSTPCETIHLSTSNQIVVMYFHIILYTDCFHNALLYCIDPNLFSLQVDYGGHGN